MTIDAEPLGAGDAAVVEAQLGRPPRSIHAVGHRCPCGLPDVVATERRYGGCLRVEAEVSWGTSHWSLPS